MYELNKTYKFEITNKIYYTGKVIAEDSINIKIYTQRDEDIILNKNNIIQSKRIE